MNCDRRAVLKAVSAAALFGGAVGATPSGGAASQEVDTSLPPGVVLFDLDGDGEYGATVGRSSETVGDDDRPQPIHVTSEGRETVDYAASVLRPEGDPALGDLDALSYDYYAGPDDGDVPDETFLVVEDDDGRHGMYLTYHDDGAAEQWRTHDVLARANGDTDGTSDWFEYTAVEENGDRTFDDVVSRFGSDARLVRIGVGRGDGVDPTVLDAFYGRVVISDRTYRFPVSVSQRRSHENPLSATHG